MDQKVPQEGLVMPDLKAVKETRDHQALPEHLVHKDPREAWV